jgi:hypothetical protein
MPNLQRRTQFTERQIAEDIRVQRALLAFESIGRQDPRSVVVDGTVYPRQSGEAQLLLDFVLQLNQNPSLPLFLACHCQHLGRFLSPRDEFPADRAGYKAWRAEASRRSAERAKAVLSESGFTPETIEDVAGIVNKQGRATNADVQTMEDALCLAFLTLDAPEFASRHSDEEMVRILKRSWMKMSDRGHQLALETPLVPDVQRLVQQALGAS